MLAQEAKQQQIMREAFRAQMLSMLASKTYCMNDFIREMKVAYYLRFIYSPPLRVHFLALALGVSIVLVVKNPSQTRH